MGGSQLSDTLTNHYNILKRMGRGKLVGFALGAPWDRSPYQPEFFSRIRSNSTTNNNTYIQI